MNILQDKEPNTYSKILKATSLFGSIHFIGLVVTIIKSKFLAVFIGPVGYGVFGMLNSIVDIIKQLSGFSLEIAGIKDISETKAAKGDVNLKVSVLIKLSLMTAILGTVMGFLFSPILSYITFRDYSMIVAILWISLAVFFKQLAVGKNAVLQGLSKLNFLARANLYANLLGLVITLPLYYFFELDAIVPVIILSSIISYLMSFFYFKKLNIEISNISIRQTFIESKPIILFGGLLTLSAFLPLLCNYIIQVFINNNEGIGAVGQFNISMIIINSYVGIIFMAMATEYYPRLTSFSGDNLKESEAVNNQAIISMLLIIPIIVFAISFLPLIIKVFFSSKFNDAIPIISWAILGMFFKSASFSIGYVIIARADSKVFTKTAVLFNSLYLLLCVLGYYFKGIEGVGVGILCYYGIHLLGVALIVKYRYSVLLTNYFYRIFIVGVIICGLVASIFHLYEGRYKIYIMIFICIISFWFSLKEINKKVNLQAAVKKYLKIGENDKKGL